jgi:hypothetical protein
MKPASLAAAAAQGVVSAASPHAGPPSTWDDPAAAHASRAMRTGAHAAYSAHGSHGAHGPTTPAMRHFSASISELLLVSRLKARNQALNQSTETMERAAKVVLVTCRHWFGRSAEDALAARTFIDRLEAHAHRHD